MEFGLYSVCCNSSTSSTVVVVVVVVVVFVVLAIVVVVVTSGSLWPRADCQATHANSVEYGRRPCC